MNKNRLIIATLAFVVFVFAAGTYFYKMQNHSKVTEFTQERPELVSTKINTEKTEQTNTLVRPHSPIIGDENAPITIVEFFDPSCESCRAFYPTIEAIHKKYPTEVRVELSPIIRSSFHLVFGMIYGFKEGDIRWVKKFLQSGNFLIVKG